ncbi:putative transcriptional regulator ATRX-like [Capsicum annuum]|nr:putative transcriptional regulator ATRX-like [Capsicum annuum]
MSTTPAIDSCTVETSDGVKLHTKIFKPNPYQEGGEITKNGSWVVVLVHPYSILGGCQSLLKGIASGVSRKGYKALTFDMRGVGRSSGKPSITGFKEVEDVVAVCKWACQNLAVNKILLVGSSAEVWGRSTGKPSITGFKEVKDVVAVCKWAFENLSVNKILLVGSSAVMRCERLAVKRLRKGRGKPKKYGSKVIRQDMTQLQLTEDMTHAGRVWRTRIGVEGGCQSLLRVIASGISYDMVQLQFTEDMTLDRSVWRSRIRIVVWRCETLAMDDFRRGRGRLKKYWREVIRHDMEQLQLTEHMTLDRKPGVYRKQPLYFSTSPEVVVWTAYTLPSPDPIRWEYTRNRPYPPKNDSELAIVGKPVTSDRNHPRNTITGAPIAGSAVDQVEQIVGYVSIGYPFGLLASVLFGRHHKNILKSPKPKLFIMGTQDGFTTVKQLNNKLRSSAGRVETHLIEGIGHFELEGPAYDSQMVIFIAEFLSTL